MVQTFRLEGSKFIRKALLLPFLNLRDPGTETQTWVFRCFPKAFVKPWPPADSRTQGFVLPGCWSPAGHPRRPGCLYPRLTATAPVFPFAGLASMHTHTPQRSLTEAATWTATHRALPSPASTYSTARTDIH